jgi:hypothetical protein
MHQATQSIIYSNLLPGFADVVKSGDSLNIAKEVHQLLGTGQYLHTHRPKVRDSLYEMHMERAQPKNSLCLTGDAAAHRR